MDCGVSPPPSPSPASSAAPAWAPAAVGGEAAGFASTCPPVESLGAAALPSLPAPGPSVLAPLPLLASHPASPPPAASASVSGAAAARAGAASTVGAGRGTAAGEGGTGTGTAVAGVGGDRFNSSSAVGLAAAGRSGERGASAFAGSADGATLLPPASPAVSAPVAGAAGDCAPLGAPVDASDAAPSPATAGGFTTARPWPSPGDTGPGALPNAAGACASTRGAAGLGAALAGVGLGGDGVGVCVSAPPLADAPSSISCSSSSDAKNWSTRPALTACTHGTVDEAPIVGHTRRGRRCTHLC